MRLIVGLGRFAAAAAIMETPMVQREIPIDAQAGVRFGRTLVITAHGDVFDHDVQAIACPANRRGVMGAGVAGTIRLAGGIEIEREAMAKAPLTIGTAIVTTSGTLAARGIRRIIHAVVSDALGAPTRKDIVAHATSSVLDQADRERVKSLLIPLLGFGLGPGRLPGTTVTEVMIEEIVAHLRRFRSRMETIVLHQQDRRESEFVQEALEEARRLFWEVRV